MTTVDATKLITPIRTDGNPVLALFIPGLSGNVEQWTWVLPRLADCPVDMAYTAPILPHPAFGGETPTVAQLAAAVADELRHQQRKVVIVGHSVGSFVALDIARQLPDEVASVIIINGGLASVARFLDSPYTELRARPRTCFNSLKLFVLVGTPTPPAVKRAIAKSKHITRLLLGHLVSRAVFDSPERRNAIMGDAGHPAIWRSLVKNRHHWPEFTADAETITSQVLFVAGAADPLGGETDTRAMAAMIPHSHVEVLSGVGHAAPLESSDTVAELIRTALDAA